MNDLNQIAQNNESAFQRGIDIARAQGLHVVLKKTGLHVVSFDQFETRHEAEQFIQNQDDTPDVQRVLLTPDTNLVVTGHDQSEDRDRDSISQPKHLDAPQNAAKPVNAATATA